MNASLVTDDTQVLRCSTSAEFLGALPHLTGLTYEPGIFVVIFRGSRAGQCVRFDLPPIGGRAELRRCCAR